MPTTDSTQPHVFLSYASADRDRVLALVAALERGGVPAWLDRSGIPGGANYGPEIVTAIRDSGALVLCCSAAAFASRNVRQEVALAWKHERAILPLLLEPAAIPDELAYWLEAAQWVELLDRPEREWLPEVLVALRRLGIVTGPPREPATTPGAPSPVGLPTPLTDLLGRDVEVREIGDLLAIHRLVTLTGPGGVGKTRLAIEVARAAAPAFPDGVGFVDLSPVRDPGLVLPTIARAHGVWDAGTDPLTDTLATAIGDRHVLHVLDNLEQVLEAAQAIAVLLSRCPRLAMLVTSRAPLAVRGEHVVPVEPLAVPDARLTTALAEIAAAPAVALFVARAAEARPGFALTTENAGVVAAICARLEGLPLAIELAASRVKLLPLDRLLARLDQALPTLTGGARDLPDRQRTLRDAIAWSYDLLPAEEQALFGRLGVFAGGWTLDAAEAIRDPDGTARVFDGLASLVDKSLVRLDHGGAEPRFGMLETIREFAVERLAASGDEDAARDRHAAWVLDLAARNLGELRDGPNSPLLHLFAGEHAILRAALSWLERTARGDDLLRLTRALYGFWYFFGFLREGLDGLARALALATAAADALRAPALLQSGLFAHFLGEVDAAERWLTEGAELARRLRDPELEAESLLNMGILAEDRGEHDRAETLFREVLEWYQATGWHWSRASTIYHLGIQAFARGESSAAVAMWEEAATIGRERGYDNVVAWSLNSFGLAAADRGEAREAATALRQSLAIGKSPQHRHDRAALLGSVAVLAASRGMPEAAVRLLGAIQAEQVATGQRFTYPERQVFERTEERLRAALGEVDYARALAEGRVFKPDALWAEVEVVLAGEPVATPV
ncbi:MAG: TIR domain-containing protein, partial [Chloroflexia bacterium]|nr:TIR domain-containing protein [Chloroflexia bacterium]